MTAKSCFTIRILAIRPSGLKSQRPLDPEDSQSVSWSPSHSSLPDLVPRLIIKSENEWTRDVTRSQTNGPRGEVMEAVLRAAYSPNCRRAFHWKLARWHGRYLYHSWTNSRISRAPGSVYRRPQTCRLRVTEFAWPCRCSALRLVKGYGRLFSRVEYNSLQLTHTFHGRFSLAEVSFHVLRSGQTGVSRLLYSLVARPTLAPAPIAYSIGTGRVRSRDFGPVYVSERNVDSAMTS